MEGHKLDSLAEITLTPAAEVKENGELNILKASAIKDGKINELLLDKGSFKSNKNSEKHFLNKGDVVFQAKGSKFEAITIDKDYENLVSSQIYFNIKIKPNNGITPVFVCWYLNSRIAQEYFEANSSGSTIKAVTKDVLLNLEIIYPHKLEQIAELTDLISNFNNEKFKTEQYLLEKELLINETIIQTLTRGSK